MTIEAGMIFTLGTKEEALEAAKQAEYTGGNFVNVPGAYSGIVETAIFKKFDSGAGGMEIIMKVCDDPENDGKSCKIMIITMKKDGTSFYKNSKGEQMLLPGVNQIRGALMPVLRKKELAAIESGEDFVYPEIVGKKIGMLINIRVTNGKTNGKVDPKKVYENADLKTFFCPSTRLCGSEILNGIQKPERLAKLIEGLKVTDETVAEVSDENASDPTDPFGDSGTPSPKDDPFASNNTDTSAADTAKVAAEAEAKAKADAEAKAKAAAEAKAKAQVDAEAAAKAKVEAEAKAAAELAAKAASESTDPATGAEENFWD